MLVFTLTSFSCIDIQERSFPAFHLLDSGGRRSSGGQQDNGSRELSKNVDEDEGQCQVFDVQLIDKRVVERGEASLFQNVASLGLVIVLSLLVLHAEQLAVYMS
jgi:hypothetical protein